MEILFKTRADICGHFFKIYVSYLGAPGETTSRYYVVQ